MKAEFSPLVVEEEAKDFWSTSKMWHTSAGLKMVTRRVGASGNRERAGGGVRRPRFTSQLHPLSWPCDPGQVTLLMFKTTGNKPSLLSYPCLCLPMKVLERSPQGEDSSPYPSFHRSRAWAPKGIFRDPFYRWRNWGSQRIIHWMAIIIT